MQQAGLLRQAELVYLELSALGVRRLAQLPVRRLRLLVERVLGIVRPDARDLARAHEARHVVDVPVRLRRIYAVAYPDYLFEVEVLLELLLYLLLRHVGVAALAEQAHLRCQQRALAVNVDGAALQHEVGRAVGVHALDVADLLRHEIVLIPREVEPVEEPAPCVERPVVRADLALVVDNERRTAVAYPCVVGGHLHHADLRRQDVACVGVLRGADAHGHRLKLAYRLCHVRKDPLRGLCPVAPVVRTLRPEHPYLLLRFKFRRHSEAVLPRGAVDTFCHSISSFPVL